MEPIQTQTEPNRTAEVHDLEPTDGTYKRGVRSPDADAVIAHFADRPHGYELVDDDWPSTLNQLYDYKMIEPESTVARTLRDREPPTYLRHVTDRTRVLSANEWIEYTTSRKKVGERVIVRNVTRMVRTDPSKLDEHMQGKRLSEIWLGQQQVALGERERARITLAGPEDAPDPHEVTRLIEQHKVPRSRSR